MANHSHLQLKLVKTKKGTYVSRWVDPNSGKKGPVVPTYTPPSQSYASPKAQQLHDTILLLGNSGGKAELDQLSLLGVSAEDTMKLQKLKSQALAHIESEQKKAQELIEAQKAAPVGWVPKHTIPAGLGPAVAQLQAAIASGDPAQINAIQGPMGQSKNLLSLKQEAQAYLAKQTKKKPATPAAVGMTPPRPAAAPKPLPPAAPQLQGYPKAAQAHIHALHEHVQQVAKRKLSPQVLKDKIAGFTLGPAHQGAAPYQTQVSHYLDALLAHSGAPGHRQHAEPKAAPAPTSGPSAAPAGSPLAKVLATATLPYFAHKAGQPMHNPVNASVHSLNELLDNAKAMRKAAKDPAGLQLLLKSLEQKKIPSLEGDESDLSAHEQQYNAHVEQLKTQVQSLLTPAPKAGSFQAPVDTAKWPAHNSAAVGAAKKVALIEQLANAGDLVSLKAMTLPHNNAGQNSYGKGVNKAHQAALDHLSGHGPTVAAAAAATAPWKPPVPKAEQQAAVKVLAPVKAAPDPQHGPGVVVGNLCRDEKGHFIPCSLPGAQPVTEGELGPFVIGIDTQKWKQGHPSVVQTQKKFMALEALVEAGDLAGLEQALPQVGANPNNYQKAMLAGWGLAQAYLAAKQGAQQLAVATTPEAPVPVPGPAAPVSLKHEAAPEQPLSAAAAAPNGIDTWKKVGGQLGSNPGAQLVDPAGQKHYVKYSKSNDHARNEVLAARLLQLAGAGVVDYTLVSTKPGTLGTATKWTDTTALPLTPGSAGLTAAQLDFATHAWLANWDVVGMGHDNLKLGPDGQPMCVDVGGALLYRAQGSPKGTAFGATCPEWDSMRSVKHNSQCAAVFGSMTSAQLVASVEKLEQLDTKLILDAVVTHGPGTPAERELLAAKLLQRRDYLIGKKNALLSAAAAAPTATGGKSAAAGLPAPKAPKPAPAPEPAFNKPQKPADAPQAVAPAFPATLTEAQLSSKTNPLNQKLWAKKQQIDTAVAGFAGGTLSAQQALDSLQELSFGVQCYQVKVGKYHADVSAALQQAAAGALAAPPAPSGAQPLPAPAPGAIPAAAVKAADVTPPVAPAPAPEAGTFVAPPVPTIAPHEVTAVTLVAFKKMQQLAKEAAADDTPYDVALDELYDMALNGPMNDAYKKVENYQKALIDAFSEASQDAAAQQMPASTSDVPALSAQMLKLPPPLVAQLAEYEKTNKQYAAIDQLYQVTANFKQGKLTADQAIYELTAIDPKKPGPAAYGPAHQGITAYKQQLEQTLANYAATGTSYAEALAEHELAWSGAPGHRKHAQPDGPSVPTHLAPAPAAAPAAKAPAFVVPTYLTAAQKKALGPDKLQQYEQIEQLLGLIQHGVQPAMAISDIEKLPNLKSGTLTKWKKQAVAALIAYAQTQPMPEPGPGPKPSAAAQALAAGKRQAKAALAAAGEPFEPPTPLTSDSYNDLPAAAKDNHDTIAEIAQLVADSQMGPAEALDHLGEESYPNSTHLPAATQAAIDQLAKYHQQVKDAFEAYQAQSEAPSAPAASAPVPLAPPDATSASKGPFSSKGSFVPPTPLSKAQLSKWNAPIQAKFKAAMAIVKKADIQTIGWQQAWNELDALAAGTMVGEVQDYLVNAKYELEVAMHGKPEKKKPVFDPSKLAKPINFLQWGDTGKPGPSSSMHYNQANHNAARLIYKTAQGGDIQALKDLQVMVPSKDTGQNIGSQPVLTHPSKWVQGYAQQLINEIDFQKNPPKVFRFGEEHPLKALNQGLPAIPPAGVSAAQKIGNYLNLGSAKASLLAAFGGKMPSAKELVGGITHKFGSALNNSQVYTTHTKDAWQKMPDQQKKAIKAYTGSSFSSMNDSMWKGNPSGQAKSAQEGLLTMGHEIKPGTLLSRKMTLSSTVLAQLDQAVGSVIQEAAINSTAIDPQVWGGNTQLKLHVGPGVKGLYVGSGSLGGSSAISHYSGEMEMMLPGNYRMLITEVTPLGHPQDADGFGGPGMRVVHAVILPNH